MTYIDKLFTSYRDLATANSRILLIMTTLALVLLAVSGGAVSAEGKLAVAGFGLRVPLAVFLTGGAILVGILAATRLAAGRQERSYKLEIMRLYRSIGFDDRTLYGQRIHPYRALNMLYPILDSLRNDRFQVNETFEEPLLFQRWDHIVDSVSKLLLWLTFLVLPVAAQIGTGIQVAELLRSRELGWIWILFILLALVTCAVNWFVMLQPVLEDKTNDPTLDVASYGRRFAWNQFLVFLAGGTLGFVVAKVLGSA